MTVKASMPILAPAGCKMCLKVRNLQQHDLCCALGGCMMGQATHFIAHRESDAILFLSQQTAPKFLEFLKQQYGSIRDFFDMAKIRSKNPLFFSGHLFRRSKSLTVTSSRIAPSFSLGFFFHCCVARHCSWAQTQRPK